MSIGYGRAGAIRVARSSSTAAAGATDPRFDAIATFLTQHRLPIDPPYYAFAHRLIVEPDGALALSVNELTDRGVRLTTQDVAMLASEFSVSTEGPEPPVRAVMKQAEAQLRSFTELVGRMQAETNSFGRELAESADAIGPLAPPELVRLTAAMLVRVRHAEAQIAAADTQSALLREQLAEARDDARSDSLTGLANRRALLEDYAAASAAADGRPMCLAVCDVDHFKRINDRFGHPVGDRVLRALAGVLADACDGARVARYGGEEFAVLFTDTTLERASETLDRARATVAAKTYRRRGDNQPLGAVTFSAGIVRTATKETFDAAFARADCLLYSAKAAGRNRVHS